PRFANDTPEHRQANRRVDITLSQGKAAEESLQLLKP
ncbi:MAG: flagellar motor protein MotB, partial [Aeromonas sp.]